jgi:hypothetical protein
MPYQTRWYVSYRVLLHTFTGPVTLEDSTQVAAYTHAILEELGHPPLFILADIQQVHFLHTPQITSWPIVIASPNNRWTTLVQFLAATSTRLFNLQISLVYGWPEAHDLMLAQDETLRDLLPPL